MFFCKEDSIQFVRLLACILAVLLLSPSVALHRVYAAMEPQFEIDTRSLTTLAPSKSKSIGSSNKRTSRMREKKSIRSNTLGTVHVVKSGENLFKILMRDYGLDDNEAKILVDEIRRENNIYDIRRLKVGQRITIPPIRRNTDGSIKREFAISLGGEDSKSIGQSFRLEPPVSSVTVEEMNTKIRPVWNKIIPSVGDELKPISIQTPTFSLTLDSNSFPMFTAMDKGKIVVDPDNAVPDLVKSMISEKDPSVRFVSGADADGKRLLSAIIANAGFFSVEEDFKLEFGADPTITVRSDFKIEKSSESILNQDVILLNAGRLALPAQVGNFLQKEGFSLHEPFAKLQTVAPAVPRSLHQVLSKTSVGILDSLLSALSITSEKDCRLDIFTAGADGISLTVNAERYIERGGQKTLITHFDGDPVSYTLFRILETRGYKVVILDPNDDFRNIADKLLLRLNIKGTYAKHVFEPDPLANYSLQMSGYRIEGAGLPLNGVFITNLEFDNFFRDVFTENGYKISIK